MSSSSPLSNKIARIDGAGASSRSGKQSVRKLSHSVNGIDQAATEALVVNTLQSRKKDVSQAQSAREKLNAIITRVNLAESGRTSLSAEASAGETTAVPDLSTELAEVLPNDRNTGVAGNDDFANVRAELGNILQSLSSDRLQRSDGLNPVENIDQAALFIEAVSLVVSENKDAAVDAQANLTLEKVVSLLDLELN